MTSPDTQLLAELIRAKRACLIALRDLGRKQLEQVAAGNLSGLLDLLAAKQPALGRLQRIERALEPFRGQDPESRHWPSPEDRRRSAEEAAECEALLAEILSQEKRAEAELVRRRDETALRLDGAHLAGRARGAYCQSTPGAARQLDLLSDA
jgi:hypothetical protein